MDRTITINGKPFAPTDPVPWEDAIEVDGFYYHRARYLGLPPPIAIMFDKAAEEAMSPEYVNAAGDYHEAFKEAEYRVARVVDDPWEPVD